MLFRLLWSEWRDSNSRHPAPKAGALPTALHPVIFHTLPLYTTVNKKATGICLSLHNHVLSAKNTPKGVVL